MHRVEFGFFEILYASWEGTGGLISQCKQKYILTPLRVPASANVRKTGMPGRNFSGPVSINMDHKGIPGHIRVCLVVKFIVNHFQSNKIMLWVVKEAMRHLMK